MKSLRFTLITLAVISIAACSSSKKDPKLDYQTVGAGQEVRLDMPPDLTTPKGQTRYTIPAGSGTASANSTQTQPSVTYNNGVLAPVKDMHIERDGSQRWLVIENKQPAEIWPILKVFWQEMGFVIKNEEPEIGLMETEWAENRAKLPNDGFRNLLEKVGIGSVYSTSERDKFFVRLEKTENGTDVFFSHKGLYEIYTSERKDTTAWQPRPSDPELEASFLGRFMVRLGADEQVTQQQLANNETPTGARARVSDNTLIVNDQFDRAWRRVGLALDRVGLTVTDRNRAEGIYYVRPALNEVETQYDKDPGFFKRLFGGKKKKVSEPKNSIMLTNKEELRVQVVQSTNGTTVVTLLDDAGQKMTSTEARTALSRLQTELQ
ncbi:outer membrane protein assembly factor BamC [Neisseria sp. Ec49-e6-T10]|uniref:outer membrane protein assembly factor BamC n=1 Tax=Neisseria sp. Ec49-e6-T10 TaxID=3140744 RepID=UPI003EBADEF4